jgi:NADPH2:quinone reductase
MRAIAPGGKWVIIGFVGGTIPQIPANRVLLRNIDVVGSSFGGSLRTMPAASERLRSEMRDLVTNPAMEPIVGSTFVLEDAASGLRMLEGRQAAEKIVLTL